MLDLIKTVFKYKEKQSPDKLGLYPEAIHTNAMPERRYLWSSRLLVIFAAISICVNMMLASTVYVMLPQRTADPVLFGKDYTFPQFTVLEKNEKPITVADLLSESFIEEYIMLRHAITADYDELVARWQQGSHFYWMSSNAVYGSFASTDMYNNINSFKASGLVRLVEIEWIKPMSRGFWVAQFITMDYYPNEQTPIINIWRAYIRTILAPINYENRSLREKNPFGFLVTNYSLSYIGTPEDPQSYLETAKEVRAESYEY